MSVSFAGDKQTAWVLSDTIEEQTVEHHKQTERKKKKFAIDCKQCPLLNHLKTT